MRWSRGTGVSLVGLVWLAAAAAQVGYYRQPGLHENALVFVAEGDVWKIGLEGGVAARLTSHPGDESSPAISPDGEAFTEGVKRLGIGKVIGTRTWGGEIWLSSSNFLVDRGIATAAEYGVYGPKGEWLIEGHGVEPDIVIDNLPHATFNGEDAQLMAAVTFLKRKIEQEPVDVPPVPAYPDKSGR